LHQTAQPLFSGQQQAGKLATIQHGAPARGGGRMTIPVAGALPNANSDALDRAGGVVAG